MHTKKWLLSRSSKFWQVFGSFCSHHVWLIITFLLLAATILSWYPDIIPAINDKSAICKFWPWFISHTKVLFFVTLLFTFVWLILSARTLSTIFTLRKEDIWITRSQIAILMCSIILIGILFVFFGTQIKSFIEASLIGTVLSWIFQDSIKGAATFVKFRSKGMLNIGDWIKLDKSGVDGKIKSITLTTIYIENWDSTTSAIPMSILYSGVAVWLYIVCTI